MRKQMSEPAWMYRRLPAPKKQAPKKDHYFRNFRRCRSRSSRHGLYDGVYRKVLREILDRTAQAVQEALLCRWLEVSAQTFARRGSHHVAWQCCVRQFLQTVGWTRVCAHRCL